MFLKKSQYLKTPKHTNIQTYKQKFIQTKIHTYNNSNTIIQQNGFKFSGDEIEIYKEFVCEYIKATYIRTNRHTYIKTNKHIK